MRQPGRHSAEHFNVHGTSDPGQPIEVRVLDTQPAMLPSGAPEGLLPAKTIVGDTQIAHDLDGIGTQASFERFSRDIPQAPSEDAVAALGGMTMDGGRRRDLPGPGRMQFEQHLRDMRRA